jgi:hypothetical protein
MYLTQRTGATVHATQYREKLKEKVNAKMFCIKIMKNLVYVQAKIF